MHSGRAGLSAMFKRKRHEFPTNCSLPINNAALDLQTCRLILSTLFSSFSGSAAIKAVGTGHGSRFMCMSWFNDPNLISNKFNYVQCCESHWQTKSLHDRKPLVTICTLLINSGPDNIESIFRPAWAQCGRGGCDSPFVGRVPVRGHLFVVSFNSCWQLFDAMFV